MQLLYICTSILSLLSQLSKHFQSPWRIAVASYRERSSCRIPVASHGARSSWRIPAASYRMGSSLWIPVVSSGARSSWRIPYLARVSESSWRIPVAGLMGVPRPVDRAGQASRSKRQHDVRCAPQVAQEWVRRPLCKILARIEVVEAPCEARLIGSPGDRQAG